jgi:histidinol-phosphate/aromatic aminotransferase/cobyric acid decarboxylase-like protein
MSTTSPLIDGFKVSVPGHSASLVPYPPHEPLEELEREYGTSLKPAGNKNPPEPSPMAVIAVLETLSRLHRYCDGNGSGHYLRKRLSDANYIRLNAGFPEENERFFRALGRTLHELQGSN